MNMQNIANLIRKDIVDILGQPDDRVIQSIYAYMAQAETVVKSDIATYSAVFNSDVLLQWVSTRLYRNAHNIFRSMIGFNPHSFMLYIDIFRPFLSRWYLSIIDEYQEEYHGIVNYNNGFEQNTEPIRPIDFIAEIPLPYYLHNRAKIAENINDVEEFVTFLFEPMLESLAKDDLKTYVDMCMEAQRCLDMYGMECKEITV